GGFAPVEHEPEHGRPGAVVAEEEEREVGNHHRRSSRLRAVRISLVDPVSYTIPYDSHLAGALAARGHEVDLYCARFAFADLPPPEGYRRQEMFFRHSAGLLRNRPPSR